MRRRDFLSLAGACGASMLLPSSGLAGFGRGRQISARDAPARCLRGRVRWLVGWSPGGGYDAYARLAEPLLERALGVQIVVDNVPGAAGRVAAATLSRARPDGRTLGILDGPGTLWSSLANERGAPDLARDFTILARIARTQQVLATSARSGITGVEGLVALSRQRRLVGGATAPGSQNFVAVSVINDLLGLDADIVVGYPGTREELLGLVRGDFDFVSINLDTAMDQIEAGLVVPLATIIPEGLDANRLAHVPHLTGDAGLVQRRPDLFPGDPARTRRVAEAMRTYLSLGRLIAAPPALPDDIERCLDGGLRAVLTDAEFVAAARRAGRTLDVAFGDDVRSGLAGAREAAGTLSPLAAAALRRIR